MSRIFLIDLIQMGEVVESTLRVSYAVRPDQGKKEKSEAEAEHDCGCDDFRCARRADQQEYESPPNRDEEQEPCMFSSPVFFELSLQTLIPSPVVPEARDPVPPQARISDRTALGDGSSDRSPFAE